MGLFWYLFEFIFIFFQRSQVGWQSVPIQFLLAVCVCACEAREGQGENFIYLHIRASLEIIFSAPRERKKNLGAIPDFGSFFHRQLQKLLHLHLCSAQKLSHLQFPRRGKSNLMCLGIWQTRWVFQWNESIFYYTPCSTFANLVTDLRRDFS